MKLDASKFKKISDDQDHAVLQHEAGHQVKIAKAGLSPKVRGQLAEIPMMLAGGYLEGQDKTTSDTVSPTGPASPSMPDPQPAGTHGDSGYHNQSAMDWNKAHGLARGGEVKNRESGHERGVHTDAGDGKSRMGRGAEMGKSGEGYEGAKRESKRVLNEMKSMPKPNLYADGGVCKNCPCPECAKVKLADGGPALPQTAEEVTTAEDHGGAPPVQPGDDWQSSSGVLPPSPADPGAQQAGMQPMDPNSPAQAADSSSPQAPGTPGEQHAAPNDGNSQKPTSTPGGNMPEYDQATRSGDGTDYKSIKDAFVQSHLKEDAAFAHDLSNGHITPQTYGSLFADKSTLGKVGMLFGMLLSGAGSGLSGQPNALLELMNKQIERDLDAQKQSKSNAQNFLKINQQQALNNAEVKLKQQQGTTYAHQNKLTDAQKKLIDIEAYSKSKMQMQRSLLHAQEQQINKMPEGPQKQQAQQALGMMFSAVNNDNYDVTDRLSAAQALVSAGGNTGQSGDPEDSYKQAQYAKRASGDPIQASLADANDQRHIPYVSGTASRPVPQDDRQQLTNMGILDQKGKDVLNFVNQHRGTWNPQTRAVAAQKIEEMKNFYNESIKGGSLTQGRLGWYDEQFAKHPTDIISQIMGSSAKLKEMVDSNATRRKEVLHSYGFPGNDVNAPSGQQQSAPASNPVTATNKKTGQKMTWDGKRWK